MVATVQLRAAGSGLSGVGLLGTRARSWSRSPWSRPGLFMPVAGLVARVALRRGRLGAGLAAVQLARRPGSQRLFVLLAVAIGLLSFVAAGTDVAARARDDRALVVTGAPRVLTVEQADVRRLLAVTRAVDPDGAWAMAAHAGRSRRPAGPAGARGGQLPGWPRSPCGGPSSAPSRPASPQALRPAAGPTVRLPRHPDWWSTSRRSRRPGRAGPASWTLTFAPLGRAATSCMSELRTWPPAGATGRSARSGCSERLPADRLLDPVDRARRLG